MWEKKSHSRLGLLSQCDCLVSWKSKGNPLNPQPWSKVPRRHRRMVIKSYLDGRPYFLEEGRIERLPRKISMMVGKEQKQRNFVAGHWDVSNVPRLTCRATHTSKSWLRGYIMLMEEIMHQLAWKASYLYQKFGQMYIYIYLYISTSVRFIPSTVDNLWCWLLYLIWWSQVRFATLCNLNLGSGKSWSAQPKWNDFPPHPFGPPKKISIVSDPGTDVTVIGREETSLIASGSCAFLSNPEKTSRKNPWPFFWGPGFCEKRGPGWINGVLVVTSPGSHGYMGYLGRRGHPIIQRSSFPNYTPEV